MVSSKKSLRSSPKKSSVTGRAATNGVSGVTDGNGRVGCGVESGNGNVVESGYVSGRSLSSVDGDVERIPSFSARKKKKKIEFAGGSSEPTQGQSRAAVSEDVFGGDASRLPAGQDNEGVRSGKGVDVQRKVGSGTVRSSGRARKPSAKLVQADNSGAGQLAGSDSGVGDVPGVVSDRSSSSRKRRRTDQNESVVEAGADRGLARLSRIDKTRSPLLELDFKSVSETDDDLPSPTTAMSAGSTLSRSSNGVSEDNDHGDPRDTDCSDVGCDVDDSQSPQSLARKDEVDVSCASGVFIGTVALSDEDSDMDFGELADDEASGEPSSLLDQDRIHPDLQEIYSSLDWLDGLRRSRFTGYSMGDTSYDDFVPVSYGTLLDSLSPRVRSKLVRSMAFVQYKEIKNVVRVPLAPFVRSWDCVKVPRCEGSRFAVFVLTGVSLRSYLSQGREVGQSYVKQLHVRPLENDWDVFQCNVGSYFNDSQLHAPGRRSALIFQTKRQGWTPRQFDRDADRLASTPYSSPAKGNAVPVGDTGGESSRADASANVLAGGAPPYRMFDDGVPLYDGRTRPGTKGFRFQPSDWDSYDRLPVYPFPEVEDDSLVSVAFTLTGFKGTNNAHHTVHFNALFAIVLGRIEG
ncbi:hypothetical protein VNI00_018031 [Paramarasmius palmivorus]|uniref:Uncharacterized protein n=1 Tax=Paramarasmius palmivorus TaxID=297713 RepID=A0AAW0B1W6_9AGAR